MDMVRTALVWIIVGIVLPTTDGFNLPIRLQDENNERVGDKKQKGLQNNTTVKYPSVHHFARHGLCRNLPGKRNLYKAIKTKMCTEGSLLSLNIVMDLCRHQNKMLDLWVTELFDLNHDGYISHFERHLFNADE